MRRLPLVLFFLLLPACGDDEPSSTGGDGNGDVTAAAVVEGYADIVEASYRDALTTAQALQAAIDTFVADPTETTLEAARDAWLAARVPYGQTEAYRFYGGPIDDADGPEGQLNAWPLDEVYIDYVEGKADAGLVNDTDFQISKASILGANEGGAGDIGGLGDEFDEEKAISTGYHAIEFLLWGQDLSASGPGERPATDFLSGEGATAPNGDRRGQFLSLIAGVLVEDLQGLVAEWEDGGAFRTAFLAADTDTSLAQVLTGIGVLSKGELAAERMDVALETLDQEDEHSCFSDNTHVDFIENVRGIQNVWLGRYGSLDVVGLDELVAQADADAATALTNAIATSLAAAEAIPVPVDQSIAVRESDGWNAINDTVEALFDQADLVVAAGLAIGLDNVSVDLPE